MFIDELEHRCKSEVEILLGTGPWAALVPQILCGAFMVTTL